MFGLSFINGLMLAGLAALSVPIVIHLLLKRKKKRLKFSTIQFFIKQDEQASQRRKLRNWLLLALRLLIFTLLVFAFARPYLPTGGAADGQPKRQVVVLMDRSASMQANTADGSKWIRAKEQIQSALADLKFDDRAALVSCATRAEAVVGLAPTPVVAKAITELTPAFGTSNLGEGLQQALKILAQGDPLARSTIYVVSDFQRSSCQSLGGLTIPENIEIKPIVVGDLFAPNLAVQHLELEPLPGQKPRFTAASFSDDESRNVSLAFNIDGKSAASYSVDMHSNGTTNLDLIIPALQPGWHGVQASLQSRDSFKTDDIQYGTLFVAEPWRVLLVETRTAPRVFEEETFFLNIALDPTRESTNPVRTAFQTTKISPRELIQKLAGEQTRRSWDLVILPGLAQVPPDSGKALNSFVQAGGGLLFCLGEGISANRYNAEFRDLLPTRLDVIEVQHQPGASWKITQVDTNSPILGPFRLANSGNLGIPEFTKRYRLLPVAGAAQPLRFDDGVPLLAWRPLGQGRVALVNTSAGTEWNDWPKHKTYVPWLHALGKFLAQSSAEIQLLGTNQFLAGDDWEITLGMAARGSQFKLQPPEGKEVVLTADDQGMLRGSDLGLPGIYTVRNQAGKIVRLFPVNVPPQESDLAALAPNQFQQQLVRIQDPHRLTMDAGFLGAVTTQKEFWRLLLFLVLALLFIELCIANRTLA